MVSHDLCLARLLAQALAAEMATLAPVADFLQHLVNGELARLRLKSVNRARAHRRLRHYLADWAPLQVRHLPALAHLPPPSSTFLLLLPTLHTTFHYHPLPSISFSPPLRPDAPTFHYHPLPSISFSPPLRPDAPTLGPYRTSPSRSTATCSTRATYCRAWGPMGHGASNAPSGMPSPRSPQISPPATAFDGRLSPCAMVPPACLQRHALVHSAEL